MASVCLQEPNIDFYVGTLNKVYVKIIFDPLLPIRKA